MVDWPQALMATVFRFYRQGCIHHFALNNQETLRGSQRRVASNDNGHMSMNVFSRLYGALWPCSPLRWLG